MAKLFELVSDGSYGTIVLDTPPSRNAVDLLLAPERLTGFLEGRALAALLRPSWFASRSAAMLLSALRRITGAGMVEDLATFFRLLAGLMDGFRSRAVEVQRLVTDPKTRFLIVTSGEPAMLDEAIHFARELERSAMHRSGVIVNRVQPLDPMPRHAAPRACTLDPKLADKVARTHADLQILAHRDQASIDRLHSELGEERLFRLADRATSVQDLDALVELARELFG